MASRVVGYWRSALSRLRGNRGMAILTAPAPSIKFFSPTVTDFIERTARAVRGDFVPVYGAVGMILLSISLGLHTAKQQLLYAPNVFVNKKRRETFVEVVEPDYIAQIAEKFIKKSRFRKVARTQDFDKLHRPVREETLKSVGVDPISP